MKGEFYVYVYIDPRNFEEFYYGKGKGSRKNAHLSDDSDSEKVKRIREIKKEGLNPIIKVIARNLSESEAFLVEKTLIWKLGKTLTNISSGNFADKFRPKNTFHLNLDGFDFNKGLYYVNVGEGNHRCWEDCQKYGFMSAGQDIKYSDPIRTLEPGDIIVAYLKGKGYVGVGRVKDKAVKVNDFKINGKSLRDFELKVSNIFENNDNENSEYLVKTEWIQSFDASEAKWLKNSNLFTSQLVKASLQKHPKTKKFLEEEFGISFEELLLAD